MDNTIIINVALGVVQLFIISIYFKSFFHLLRIRKEMDRFIFTICICGIALALGISLFNISDPEYVMQRFPFNLAFYLISGLVFYYLSKSKKEDLFTIQNVIKQEYSEIENKVMSKIDAKNTDKPMCVPAYLLEEILINKEYKPSKKTQTKRMMPPNNVRFKFDAQLLKGGEFGAQFHPDLDEFINVDFGVIRDNYTGVIYRQGETITIPAGQVHNIEALERSGISAYLFDA